MAQEGGTGSPVGDVVTLAFTGTACQFGQELFLVSCIYNQ